MVKKESNENGLIADLFMDACLQTTSIQESHWLDIPDFDTANTEGDNHILGRKNYTQEEIDNGKTVMNALVAAYRQLAKAIASEKIDHKIQSAQADFEGLFLNNLTLVLDRYYVHQLRMVTGKEGNPLNEEELICASLMNNNEILQGNNVIKYIPEQFVVKLNIGEKICLISEQFERLSAAFFAVLKRKFLVS